MSSSLASADVPATVTSGTAFNITVRYESLTGGKLRLSVDAGFSLDPTEYVLAASHPGSATFPVTVTRGTATTKGCTLSLRFGSALDPRIDEVK